MSQQLAPGQILRLHCSFRHNPHTKWLVTVYCQSRPGFFFINSGIDAFVQSQPDLLRCQIPMHPSDYPFLSYQSFLACHEVKMPFSTQEIEIQLADDPARVEGEITSHTRAQILEVIEGSLMISPVQVRWITDGLSRV